MPEEYGGGTVANDFAVMEAQVSVGETGFGNHVHSGLLAYYLQEYGSEEQKQRWLPGMATGELIGVIAMTEPAGGPDLKAMRTTAIHDGDHYVLDGSKTFTSNGSTADIVILVVKTDPSAGTRGISLVVLETKQAKGFSVSRVLDKLGMMARDTSELFFDDVRVPVANLLGEEGKATRTRCASSRTSAWSSRPGVRP